MSDSYARVSISPDYWKWYEENHGISIMSPDAEFEALPEIGRTYWVRQIGSTWETRIPERFVKELENVR